MAPEYKLSRIGKESSRAFYPSLVLNKGEEYVRVYLSVRVLMSK